MRYLDITMKLLLSDLWHYLTGLDQFPSLTVCCPSECLYSHIPWLYQSGSQSNSADWPKTLDLEIRAWNLFFLPEIFVFVWRVYGSLSLSVWLQQRNRQVEGDSIEAASRGQREPREKKQTIFRGPDVHCPWGDRAVTWHSDVPACSADVGQPTSVSHNRLGSAQLGPTQPCCHIHPNNHSHNHQGLF